MDGLINVWDASDGAELYTLRGHHSGVRGGKLVDWSPDGSRFATGGVDGMALIWDASPVTTIEAHSATFHAYWSPTDDRILRSGDDGSARIWDSKTGVELLSVKHGGNALPMGRYWSPDGDRFAMGLTGYKTRIWDAQTGTELHSFSIPVERELETLTEGCIYPGWSPDGKRIAAMADFSGLIKIWDAISGQELLSIPNPSDRESVDEYREALRVEWSPSGDRLMTADRFEGIKVWDTNTGEELLHIDDFETYPNVAMWSPDGKSIATYTMDNTGNIWDAQSGEKLVEFHGHQGDVWGIGWAPSGKRLATGGYDGTVRVWNAENGQEVLRYSLGLQIQNVDWSHDGTRILASVAGKIIILPTWNSKEELIDYAKDCCVVRQMLDSEREEYGLPPVQGQ
jgi:WD40 repeat protein